MPGSEAAALPRVARQASQATRGAMSSRDPERRTRAAGEAKVHERMFIPSGPDHQCGGATRRIAAVRQ
jgi:hypothetical protein